MGVFHSQGCWGFSWGLEQRGEWVGGEETRRFPGRGRKTGKGKGGGGGQWKRIELHQEGTISKGVNEGSVGDRYWQVDKGKAKLGKKMLHLYMLQPRKWARKVAQVNGQKEFRFGKKRKTGFLSKRAGGIGGGTKSGEQLDQGRPACDREGESLSMRGSGKLDADPNQGERAVKRRKYVESDPIVLKRSPGVEKALGVRFHPAKEGRGGGRQ